MTLDSDFVCKMVLLDLINAMPDCIVFATLRRVQVDSSFGSIGFLCCFASARLCPGANDELLHLPDLVATLPAGPQLQLTLVCAFRVQDWIWIFFYLEGQNWGAIRQQGAAHWQLLKWTCSAQLTRQTGTPISCDVFCSLVTSWIFICHPAIMRDVRARTHLSSSSSQVPHLSTQSDSL